MSDRARTLSVILTNYNHAHFLPRALNAIVHQSQLPHELILVDDTSSDNSVAIMRDYASRYPFIKVHANERNMGVTPASNVGMGLASGDFVQRCAADDYMLPGCIETLMAMADRWPQAGIVCGPLTYIDESEDDDWAEIPKARSGVRTLKMDWPAGFHSPEEYAKQLETGTMLAMASLSPSTLYRTNLVRQYGGWPADLGMHEVSFILRACGLTGGVAYTETPVYMWIERAGGLTADEENDRTRLETFVRRQALRMRQPPFDTLFSDAFRKRWDAETEALFAPKPAARLSLRQRLFARVAGRRS